LCPEAADSNGTGSTAGVGGLGGNGGFRGGDASAQAINSFTQGGAGFGPVAARPRPRPLTRVEEPSSVVLELVPLAGGSGGGGGAGFGTSANCTGGGGGGGGGALLIAANGTIRITNYDVNADGGTGGSVGNSSCTRGGGGGSGGAIRLVARSLSDGAPPSYARVARLEFQRCSRDGRTRPAGVDRYERADAVHCRPAAVRVTGPGHWPIRSRRP
jgi:hypothetical protein